MNEDVTDPVTVVNPCRVTGSVTEDEMLMSYATGMVPKHKKRARAQLFINEWLKFRGLSVSDAATKLGIERESLHRWIKEQNRINAVKIAQLATILDIEPQELWRSPNQVSLDAIVAGTDDEIREMAADIVRRLVKDSR